MPNNATVNLQFGSMPNDYEPTDANDFVQQLDKIMTAYLPGNYNLFNYGNSTPSAEDQDKPWIRTIAGAPDRVYVFYNGKWVCKHEVPASGNERRLWVGSESDLWSYDGGDGVDPSSVAPAATTGAMWEVDTAFEFKMPIGVGTNETTYDGNTATAVSVNGTGGAERVAISAAETPEHTHGFANEQFTLGKAYLNSRAENEGVLFKGPAGASGAYDVSTDAAGSGESHQNMPPYIGVYFIKRTSRVYRCIS